jgi:hypothetical protein
VGADLGGLTLQDNYTTPVKTPFGNKLSATVGLEAESILPFNKNKWAIVFQSSYHSYRSDLGGSTSADYKMIGIGLGPREYFYIGKDSKLFATALLLFEVPLGSGAVVDGGDSLGYALQMNAAFSAGYKFRNQWSLELQYTANHDILGSYEYWQGQYHSFSLIFAYTIL